MTSTSNFSYRTDRYEINNRGVLDRRNGSLIGFLLDNNDLTAVISASGISHTQTNKVIEKMFFQYELEEEAK